MKKLIVLCFSCVLFIGIGIMPSSVKAQRTLEYDINPENGGRVFDDRTIGGTRFIGCAGTNGTCGASIVILG
jgi:hypothetical protein